MSAIDTFRRAMRRHEKRARQMGCWGFLVVIDGLPAHHLAVVPFAQYAAEDRKDAEEYRGTFSDLCASNRRSAFLYSLAADAVARLRVGLAEEEAVREPLLYRCTLVEDDQDPPNWDEVF